MDASHTPVHEGVAAQPPLELLRVCTVCIRLLETVPRITRPYVLDPQVCAKAAAHWTLGGELVVVAYEIDLCPNCMPADGEFLCLVLGPHARFAVAYVDEQARLHRNLGAGPAIMEHKGCTNVGVAIRVAYYTHGKMYKPGGPAVMRWQISPRGLVESYAEDWATHPPDSPLAGTNYRRDGPDYIKIDYNHAHTKYGREERVLVDGKYRTAEYLYAAPPPPAPRWARTAAPMS